jgi:adenylylsulfate kinase-like enzyme
VIPRATPVLWLCGPAGVGKTAVGWEYFSGLARTGVAASFVDIDQLGMCYPEPAADPGRYRMKTQNLASVAATFAASGTQCVVVSGVVDPRHGAHAELLPHAALTLGRLRAARNVVAERLAARTGTLDGVEDALREADELDAADFGDFCVDTTSLTVPEVAGRARERSGGWPSPTSAAATTGPAAGQTRAEGGAPARELDAAARELSAAGAGPVLLMCGPTGVGKSTVGWDVYLRLRGAGLTVAYLDLDQVGFCWPAPPADPGNHRVKARNLAAIWANFRAAGAQCLVAVGPVDGAEAASAYAGALPAATMTLCRLHAGPAELMRRIMRRGVGDGSWSQPGDPLIGKPPAELRRVAEEAAATADRAERAAPGELRVDTEGRTPAEAADVVVAQLRRPAQLGWPGLLARHGEADKAGIVQRLE